VPQIYINRVPKFKKKEDFGKIFIELLRSSGVVCCLSYPELRFACTGLSLVCLLRRQGDMCL